MEAELVTLKNESESARPDRKIGFRSGEAMTSRGEGRDRAAGVGQPQGQACGSASERGDSAKEFKALEEEFKATLGQAAKSLPAVLEAASHLLGVLETICVAPGSSGPPERLVQSMHRLRGAMKEPGENDIPAMEVAPGDAQAEQAVAAGAVASDEASGEKRTRSASEAFVPAAPALLSLGYGDDPMSELEAVDEDDVEALAEIARRLKKARR